MAGHIEEIPDERQEEAVDPQVERENAAKEKAEQGKYFTQFNSSLTRLTCNRQPTLSMETDPSRRYNNCSSSLWN